MKNIAKVLTIIGLVSIASFAQKPKPKTPLAKTTAKTAPKTAVKAAPKKAVDEGKLVGRTYTNQTFNFEITFPDAWLVPDKDFEAYMLAQGIDVRLKVPPTITVLQTAYKLMPGTQENSIVRVAVEDLKANPQIKDAVDYFDAMRKSFKAVKTPADFKYSETNAEKLGAKQFAYLDTSSAEAGKKRIYATVKDGYAIMFMMTYKDDADIATLRSILAEGNFALK